VIDRINSRRSVFSVKCEPFFLNVFQTNFVYLVVVMAQKARRRPLATEAWVRFRFSPCEYVVHRMARGMVLLRVLPPFPVIITPPMLHTHLNVPVTGRTNGRSLRTFKWQFRFENRGALYV
jgi:hypothetical protein